MFYYHQLVCILTWITTGYSLNVYVWSLQVLQWCCLFCHHAFLPRSFHGGYFMEWQFVCSCFMKQVILFKCYASVLQINGFIGLTRILLVSSGSSGVLTRPKQLEEFTCSILIHGIFNAGWFVCYNAVVVVWHLFGHSPSQQAVMAQNTAITVVVVLFIYIERQRD